MTDEYIGKMILTYSDEGHPLATVEFPWPPGTVELYEELDLNFVITDIQDIRKIYVQDDQVMERQEADWVATQGVVALGDSFVISGLPLGAQVKVGPQIYTVDDGSFEFESDIQGTFPYSVQAWPYYTQEGTMVFE